MSEQSVIQNTVRPATVASLCDELRLLGIRSGDILLVHSSLSKMGWVCGGPVAVNQALLASIGTNGTLVMPAHTGDNSDPAEWVNPPVPADWLPVIYDTMPAFEPAVTPTRGMGRIAECFRTWPGTRRSGHPQVSFCANGPRADEIVRTHALTPQFGMDTPLGRLYLSGAKVLLLGVGYGNCTSFHLAEVLSGIMPRKKMGAAVLENGVRTWAWFEDTLFDDEDFTRIGQAYEETSGAVSHGKAGTADCRLFDLRAAVDFAAAWIARNRKY